MNKNSLIVPALLAGTMAFSSCGSDAIIQDESRPYAQPSAQGTMTFTATTGEEADTRASLDGLDIVWNVGDAISLFSSADLTVNNKLTLTAGEGTASGSFKGDCAKGTEYFAFYPYNAGNKFEKASPNVPKDLYTIVWDGLQQTAVDGSFDPRTPMLARTVGVEEGATSVPLQFKNVLSFVKLTTDFTCRSITLTSKNNKEYLAAKQLVFDIPATGVPTLFTKIEYSHSLALQGADDALIAAGTYYIAVLPGTLSQGFELTFTGINDSDLTQTRSTSKSVTLNRSEVLNLGVIMMNDFKHDRFLGSGTEADPYKITSYDDWVLLVSTLNDKSTTNNYNSKYYEMTDDIDCRDKNPLTPIKETFKGHFNGNNHKIKYYRIAPEKYQQSNCFYYCGLFDNVSYAVIENMNCVFENIIWDDNSLLEGSMSPFINSADHSMINNCHLSGAATLQLEFTPVGRCHIGGLIGYIGGHVDDKMCVINCSNAVNIDIYAKYNYLNDIDVGGIVGYAFGWEKAGVVKIDRCRNKGSIDVFGEQALNPGGIVGCISDQLDVETYITNCVNVGNIKASSADPQNQIQGGSYAGGIVGKLDSDGKNIVPHFYNCLNKGKIEAINYGEAWAGGIIGWAYIPTLYDDPHLFNCANRGQAVAKSGAYPFVGNTGSYKVDKFAKCCRNDYKFGSEAQGPQIIADEMNENIGSAKIHSVTNNDEKWVDYSFGCCRWTGDGTTLDLDFSTSVK